LIFAALSALSSRFVQLLTASLAALAIALPVAAEPAIWVAKSPIATVYLFGSVHLLKADAQWRSAKLERALAASQELWLEVANLDDAVAARPLIAQLGLDPQHPLSNKLDDVHRAKLAALLQGVGAPANALDPMRPWLAGLTVELMPLQKAGFNPNAGVDVTLKADAVKRGEPVKGFETLEQQFRYFADLKPKDELDFFNESLDDSADGLKIMTEVEHAWEIGDVPTIAKALNDDMPKPVYDVLVVKRNQDFARQIRARMQSPGVVLVVVGAAHLAGPDSVQAQLASLGVKTERF
jgi:uncharacterized protein YbaP (TraB family)